MSSPRALPGWPPRPPNPRSVSVSLHLEINPQSRISAPPSSSSAACHVFTALPPVLYGTYVGTRVPATWPPSIHGPRTGRERHIGSPSLVTGSARAKQKHVLRRGEGREGKGMGSKQQGGRPLHATHPSHGPPATHNLYLHEIARSCISNTHKKKTARAALRARHLSMCFRLGVQVAGGWSCPHFA